jgi:hypothetical protein
MLVTCKQRSKWIKSNVRHMQEFHKLRLQYETIRAACPVVLSQEFPMIPAEALLSLDHLWEGRFKDKLKIHRKFMLCMQVNLEQELLANDAKAFLSYYSGKQL